MRTYHAQTLLSFNHSVLLPMEQGQQQATPGEVGGFFCQGYCFLRYPQGSPLNFSKCLL